MADDLSAYLTIAEFRDVMRDAMTAHDSEYRRAILAASRQIDRYCARRFFQDAVVSARLYRAAASGGSYCIGSDLLWTDDISTTTGLIVETDDSASANWTAWDSTDFQVEPLRAMNEGCPVERIAAIGTRLFPVDPYNSRRPLVRITAKWGWAAVPDQVKQATALLAKDHFLAAHDRQGLRPGVGTYATAPIPTGSHAADLLVDLRALPAIG
jgi:hypothetical protein